ncbi:Uncharacterised protein [Candidatus Gugararchaeum adminiculabundum]|nr:Uncharacterised protein [Candidatus Gugararchaeum adminiculabundum]
MVKRKTKAKKKVVKKKGKAKSCECECGCCRGPSDKGKESKVKKIMKYLKSRR